MSLFNRGPAPKRRGSVDTKPFYSSDTSVEARPRPFVLSDCDDVLMSACRQIGGVVVCGGWVRDKMIGVRPKDFDLVVAHEKFERFNRSLPGLLKKIARLRGLSYLNLEKRSNRRNLRCGSEIASYKFRLTNTATGESTDMEIDAKQLYPGQDFTSDIKFRDFSVNCMFYCPQKDRIYGRSTHYRHLAEKKLHHSISVEDTMTDPVRYLRAFRLKHEKGLEFSKELESYLRIDEGNKFSGCFFKTSCKHAHKASPLEYKKIINNPKILPACMAEIYEYGYIFRWRSDCPASKRRERAALLKQTLADRLPLITNNLAGWRGWRTHPDRDYFARVLLVAVAVFELDRSPEGLYWADFLRWTDFYLLFCAFVPEDDRKELPGFLSKLAEDYKQGVPELSGLREYRRAFRPDLPTVLTASEQIALEKATPKQLAPVIDTYHNSDYADHLHEDYYSDPGEDYEQDHYFGDEDAEIDNYDYFDD